MYFLLVAALVADPNPTPEEKALAYLAREVPRWSVENKCYSCHNNGDAARALYQAKRHSYAVPAKALENTTRWLERPADWAHNGGEGPFNDKVLSRIQFASSLLDALESGYTKDREPLKKAADLIAEQQTKEGFWQIAAADSLGSPATHGNCLATVFARRVLARADPERHRDAIAAGDRWLRAVPVKTVLDAAAVLLGLAEARDDEAKTQCKRCLALIRKGEAKEGGWGPYVTSPPEPFDTAVVLLALARLSDQHESIRRGRAFLISTQRLDGAWRETTRPAGDQSYAQRVSTTGWALQALLATRNDLASR
jgi:squalene cyclase